MQAPTDFPPEGSDADAVLLMLTRAGVPFQYEDELPDHVVVHTGARFTIAPGYEPTFVFTPDGEFVGMGLWA